MTHAPRLALLLTLLLSTSCVFSIGGSGKRSTPGTSLTSHSMDYSMSIPGRPDYFPGDGLPVMVAPWESEMNGVKSITGVGYSSLDDEQGEAGARTSALEDAMSRATTMMGGQSFYLIEVRTYSAVSDTHLGVKIQYLIQVD